MRVAWRADRFRADHKGTWICLRAVAVLLILSGSPLGCLSTPIQTPQQRLRIAEEIAAKAHFTRLTPEPTDDNALPVVAWVRRAPNKEGDETDLHVYIEGDGLAWRSRRRISKDPTPIRPTGLELAAADPSLATVAYLGRPCQYGIPSDSACRPFFWTAARHGEAVLEAMSRRIDGVLAELDHEGPLTLIGHSGGGVVAALLAARREDVTLLVTIAAPLDLDGWTRSARVSPLSASLSPMDRIETLRSVRQHHFAGRDDSVVPVATIEAFHHALGGDAPSELTIVEEMDHRGWSPAWGRLTAETGLFEERP